MLELGMLAGMTTQFSFAAIDLIPRSSSSGALLRFSEAKKRMVFISEGIAEQRGVYNMDKDGFTKWTRFHR